VDHSYIRFTSHTDVAQYTTCEVYVLGLYKYLCPDRHYVNV